MWGGIGTNNNNNFKYKKIENKTTGNNLIKHTKTLFNTELDRYDDKLLSDYMKVLKNGCIYVPNLFEKTNDRIIYNSLKHEIENNDCNMITWSKHFKYENPNNLPTLCNIVKQMADHFNVTVHQTRLNYYPDNKSWKPFHKDSHILSEDFTMGASFGSRRELVFKHEASEKTFKFPQNNGDCFAFTSLVNDVFLHGVPKSSFDIQPRFSIIAWGKKN